MLRGRNHTQQRSTVGWFAPSAGRQSGALARSNIPGTDPEKGPAAPMTDRAGEHTLPLARALLVLVRSFFSRCAAFSSRTEIKNWSFGAGNRRVYGASLRDLASIASCWRRCRALCFPCCVLFDSILTFDRVFRVPHFPALHSVPAAAFFELSLSPSGIPSLLATASSWRSEEHTSTPVTSRSRMPSSA